MRKGLFHNFKAIQAMASGSLSAAGDGVAIDRKGFHSILFVVNAGAITGAGDFGVKVQESDMLASGYSDAAASDVISGIPATLVASSACQVEYIGKKRFARLTFTKAGGTSIQVGAVAMLGRGHVQVP